MKPGRILIAIAALIVLAIVAAPFAVNLNGGNTGKANLPDSNTSKVDLSGSNTSNVDRSTLNRVDLIGANGTATTVYVEIADTPEEQEQGLMHRASLDGDKGMLFIFDDEYPLQFWMKNTMIPLDIIFINASYDIVDIDRNATPYSEAVYTSRAPSKYVVEVNGRFCEEHGIGTGDRVKIYLNSTLQR